MAQEVIMPKLGNTVESVVIVEWHKDIGDSVALGDVICEVETDKATVNVEAEVAGTLLTRLFDADEDVPVLVPFAIVGESGEDVSRMTSGALAADSVKAPREAASNPTPQASPAAAPNTASAAVPADVPVTSISPRARKLAASSGLGGLPAIGTGPGGRIIQRDVQNALKGRSLRTKAASAVGGPPPSLGTGIGGRVTTADLAAASGGLSATPASTAFPGTADFPGPVDVIPVKGVRKLIAQRMHASLLETAQFTLNSSASAASLLAWKARYKASPKEFGLAKVSINDLLMFAVLRLLKKHPELNATFLGGEIRQFRHVHLGFAVDTPKGLMVPVVRFAHGLSLSELSDETHRLATACRKGKATPDELSGGTFTITNLGAFGIETFTPVLNAPEVAILGVGSIVNYPVETDSGMGIEKRIGLSLTINHQAVDGAPGARFLKNLSRLLANLEWAAAL